MTPSKIERAEGGVPEWAIARAKSLRNEGFERGDKTYTDVFARYIAEHEEEPVDPLLIEAREVVANYASDNKGYEIYAPAYRMGGRDGDAEVAVAYRALIRGIELAGEAK